MKKEKSCGAVVYRETGEQIEILLIRHKNGGHWAFPKGHVEKKETEEDTALREIREETGPVSYTHLLQRSIKSAERTVREGQC